jgi:hypothetical protein
MGFLRELFSDSGSISMMRVLCLIALLIACVLALTGHDSNVVAFLTAAFGGKTAQKYIENQK